MRSSRPRGRTCGLVEGAADRHPARRRPAAPGRHPRAAARARARARPRRRGAGAVAGSAAARRCDLPDLVAAARGAAALPADVARSAGDRDVAAAGDPDTRRRGLEVVASVRGGAWPRPNWQSANFASLAAVKAPSSAPRWQRLEHDERRQQILACARKLFSERNYAAVSTSDIAREAGVARGSAAPLLRHQARPLPRGHPRARCGCRRTRCPCRAPGVGSRW